MPLLVFLQQGEFVGLHNNYILLPTIPITYTAKQEEKRNIARNMLFDNEPNEKIRYTGLTLEQIEQLRNEQK